MTSSRPRDVGHSFASRRGHANQLSISDSSHHITETIGTLYGDDDDYSASDSRPMSFIAAPYGGEQISRHRQESLAAPEEHRLRLVRSHSDNTDEQSFEGTNGSAIKKSNTISTRRPSETSLNSPGSPRSPMSPTLREMTGGESSQFPIGNIENASDIAQELSNLQALRRMSMDVSNNHDPDLLPFQGMSLMAMPSIAPQGDDDENDPSRLLWVPAGVHPELAPTEFKNFLEKRVQTIKRRSSESTSSLSVDGLDRSDSGLRRKKSMLSRQIDNAGGRGADGYMDGADRLGRRSSTSEGITAAPEGLSLDELVKDPTKAVQKLALESQSGADGPEDMPILPVAPGMGLRRSTRTTYRKGGSFKDRSSKGDRLPFSKRIAARKAEEGGEEADATDSTIDAPPGYGFSRVQSAPIGATADNFSRPSRSVRRQQTFTRETGEAEATSEQPADSRDTSFQSHSRNNSASVPTIVETPAAEPSEHNTQQQAHVFPERSSSQSNYTQSSGSYDHVPDEPPARSSRRPNYSQQGQPRQQQPPPAQPPQNARHHKTEQSLNEPSGLPGGNNSRTDSLTFIPTFAAAPEEKRSDKKSKKDRSDSDSTSSKGTSWKWFKSEDKDKKKKDEKKDKDEESKRSKAKAFVEKAHDNVRLDVLQNSIDNVKQKGRESLLLDRENVDEKLEEERRKESHRKSEHRKEKDGLFSNLFGGKKKGDRDSGGKKSHSQRPVSPEPAPYRPLVPDKDYHWTRFPILEERAIYRMAHIKLANPRRALQSQVLLSNFMYAYLAKVQAMHPQIQVPQSPQQKRLQEEERRRRELEQQQQQYLEQQQYMEQQQQAQEAMDQYSFEYHRTSNSYGDTPTQQSGDYTDDAEVYDYEHGQDQYDGDHSSGYQQNDRRHNGQDDMW
ncbi:hypothetical protein PFICI_14302 [Pestalotiopsis fici W106-1]|uniref:Protein Zds1 C-terminal domain-containing protein n=1 Tax=Pestalotiopsis fici (strain W106-1 / CGMCC3.15140) TaxID=1229662 RepID=W3WNN3_PESFW|nr:uncharacterized protein PFICI_14302 [Pestalotiopsis fici W106-1]ETS74436.1 hypothetical protein PFICI_14302 [Pestalotiopsis fici W106-1]